MASEQDREVVVVADAAAIAEAAANRLVARVTTANERAAACLAGGSSPERLYRLLAEEPWRGRVPWHRVHWFIGDDRLVPADDPRNNMSMVRRLLLDRVDAPPGNIHPMATDASTPDAAARRYEDELKRFYGAEQLDPARPLFDLVLMGLGSDGHTASLFPHAPALDEKAHWVVGVAMSGLEPFVPRVTLTFPALASTREMLFLVNGHGKREVLRRVLAGDNLPACHARANGELIWLVDRAAMSEDHHAR